MSATRPLAVITGASAGIGLELAKLFAANNHDLLIAADQAKVKDVAEELRRGGVNVEYIQADLASLEGVDQVVAALHGRPVSALVANAGHGFGGSFLDQDFSTLRHVIDTNVTGTIYLLQRLGRQMRERKEGRILITGSEAGFIPGTYHAVYNGTKAFINSFSFALRGELKGTGVTVTCLMPGATDTEFFGRAEMQDTQIGAASKDDPAEVARIGYGAMMRGDGDVVYGWKNKVMTSIANVTPAGLLAEQHRKKAAPGSAQGNSSQWPAYLVVGIAVTLATGWLVGQQSSRKPIGRAPQWW